MYMWPQSNDDCDFLEIPNKALNWYWLVLSKSMNDGYVINKKP